MNVYTNNRFTGFYPVGTAAVIVAPDAATAAAMLTKELTARFLPGAVEADMVLVHTETPGVTILNDGDY